MKKVEMFGTVVVFAALMAFASCVLDALACTNSATNACNTGAKACVGECDWDTDDATCACDKEDGDINAVCNCVGTKKAGGGG
jgi:hypothetical protein